MLRKAAQIIFGKISHHFLARLIEKWAKLRLRYTNAMLELFDSRIKELKLSLASHFDENG